MNLLVLGGTRLMGKHLVAKLVEEGHRVTVGTRGLTPDPFGDKVRRICFDRTKREEIQQALSGTSFDVVYDSLAYCSNDVENLLDFVKCHRYIEISSAAVYRQLHQDTKEEEFPATGTLIYCNRNAFEYSEIKRQAEYAIVQAFSRLPSVRVRFPFVIGEDDYTNRLYFYVEHILKQIPMAVDNFQSQLAFVQSREAGLFLAFLADSDFCGAINGASVGTIPIEEVAAYLYQKTGKTILLSKIGEKAPYNGLDSHTLNVDTAKNIGFPFTSLDSWIYPLLDHYIARCQSTAL